MKNLTNIQEELYVTVWKLCEDASNLGVVIGSIVLNKKDKKMYGGVKFIEALNMTVKIVYK